MSRGIIGVTVGTPISPKAIERKIKPVKSVNGVTPDDNGNVAVDTMDEQSVQYLVENAVRAIDPVLSVNGVEPDENGNVNIEGGTGEDGFSPVAKVTQTSTGAVISITDKSGTTTATLANGKDGADGVGIKSVAQTTTSNADDGNNVITVTLTNGTKSTFKVQNGSKGSKGDKGDTGEQGIQGIQGEKGETGADGKDGEPGKDGSARVLLWSNPRPRYDFAAQSVPLDLSGYDGVEVLFHEYDDSADNVIISSGYIPLDFEYSNYGQGTLTRGLSTRYRCFRIAPTGFEFETAYTFEDGNLAEDSWYIVPYRIYGFKNCECDDIGSGGSGGDVANLGALAYKDKVGIDDLDANLSYVVNDRVSQAEYVAAMQDIADAIESLEKEVADRVIYNEFIGAMTDIDYRKVDAQFKQTYTEEEKALARANIGATTVAEVLAALPIYNGEVETV